MGQIKFQFKSENHYILLQDFLKLSGETQTGGEAKIYLQEVKVLVNGDREDRRGRKLYDGDIVKIGRNKYLISEYEDNETEN
ncbi:MAG: RNA-binding S4 domain-containing protein [Coprobacillus sp.]|nr:RNA-binding S4 domain-containing protein [Coprobacillus sp.]